MKFHYANRPAAQCSMPSPSSSTLPLRSSWIGGIGLAGLLARIIADLGNPDPLPYVPLAGVDGVFAGSDLFILGPALAYHVAYVRSLRPTAMTNDLALRDSRRGQPLDQITLRDERKNLLDTRSATSATTLVAFGNGDVDHVKRLLTGIASIGAKRSSCYGEIAALRVSTIDHPHAGFADRHGNPLRPVPVDVWRKMNLPPRPVRNLVAHLPRWASPREPCVGPRDWTMELAVYEAEIAP
jgi:hypothetical protein